MKKLKKVYIEITNISNMSCSFCPGTSRKHAFMEAGEFETILKKLTGITEHIYFHVMGEPLLHPQLARFLELSKVYGFKVNITTNGVLIKKQVNTLIKSPALRQVSFSLHSHEKISCEDIIDSYLKNIFDFTRLALSKSSISVSYRLWNITSENAGAFNVFIAEKLEQYFKPGFSVIEAIKSKNRISICDRVFLNSADVFNWPSTTKEEACSNAFCLGMRDQAAVLVDGTVVPCCLDCEGVINLGNIFNEDLMHIINGKRAKALYDGFTGRRAVEELCKRCIYRTRVSNNWNT